MIGTAGPRPHDPLLARVPALAGRCRMHPRTGPAGEHVLRWARQVGLAGTGAAEQRLRHIGSHRMAGRVFSESTEDELLLFARWFAWIMTLDDHWDERALAPTIREVDHTYERLAQVVERGVEPVAVNPLERAFTQLWQAVAPSMSPAWHERFLLHLGRHHRATRWEVETRLAGRPASLDDYPPYRRATFATFIYDVGEAIFGTELPAALVSSPAWTNLADAANDAAAWCNDVLTQDKDRAGADLTNYVLVAEHHLGLSPTEATDWVVDRIAVRMDDLHDAARALPAYYRRTSTSHGVARAASKVACAYLAVPHANLEWTIEAGRYRPPEVAGSPGSVDPGYFL